MESMENKLRKELMILDGLNIKPNYAELARQNGCDWRTVKKYHNGYEGKAETRNRTSKLDQYKNIIKEKFELSGVTIKAVYEYLLTIDTKIGKYSNFNAYVKKHHLQNKKSDNNVHPRFETNFGEQLQFDWKEDCKLYNKHGQLFEFNVFSATLSASRLHIFEYSKNKTREDVERCLVETFKYIGGVTQYILTDNMSSIVNYSTKKFVIEFNQFCKDMGTKPKHCKIKSPNTKRKSGIVK